MVLGVIENFQPLDLTWKTLKSLQGQSHSTIVVTLRVEFDGFPTMLVLQNKTEYFSTFNIPSIFKIKFWIPFYSIWININLIPWNMYAYMYIYKCATVYMNYICICMYIFMHLDLLWGIKCTSRTYICYRYRFINFFQFFRKKKWYKFILLKDIFITNIFKLKLKHFICWVTC